MGQGSPAFFTAKTRRSIPSASGPGSGPGLAALLLTVVLVAVGRPSHAIDAGSEAAPVQSARPCPGGPIHVLGGTVAEREAVCRGGADAVLFFEGNGLSAPERVDVEIGTPLPPALRDSAAGCYDRSTRRVLLVDYERLLGFGTWFGQPIVPATYHALATHEVAHAIAACHFEFPNPSYVAHEFVAYAAALERMDPALRARILAAHPDEDLGDTRLSDLMHALDPTRFAVDAWLFWRQPGNGAGLIRRVFRGEALGGNGGY
jgi:hypothetical protein